MQYYFILNPLAGSGSGIQQIKEKISRLAEKESCLIYTTRGPRDATEYVEKMCEEYPDERKVFIACGGDGTVNEVFTGAIGKENAAVSVYPCGSGNDFVKSFGGAEKFLELDKLIHAPARKLDALKSGLHYSFNVLNFGFDTAVAVTVQSDRAKNKHGSKRSYTKGILKALVSSMKNRARIYADGELLNPDESYLLCTLGNGQYVGGSFRCAPRAKSDDGLIELCLIKTLSRLRFIRMINIYKKGEHLDAPCMRDIVIYRRARKVRVEAPEGFAYSLDGEIVHKHRFDVEVIPGALDVLIPD